MTPIFNVFTTFSINHYELYGKNFVNSFISFWPENINLYIYYDSDIPKEFIGKDKRIHWLEYEEQCPNQKKFAFRNKHIPQKEWYMEATRFSYKAYSIISHLNKSLTKYSIWLDADTLSLKTITQEWLFSLINEECYLSALLREKIACAESGFILFDTSHADHNVFVALYTKMYDEDLLFSLTQWHDAYIFTRVLDYMKKNFNTKIYNLSPENEISHPFAKGVLGEYIDHMKGNRKLQGFSQERIDTWR